MGSREPNSNQPKKTGSVQFRSSYVNTSSMLNPTHSLINGLGNGLGQNLLNLTHVHP